MFGGKAFSGQNQWGNMLLTTACSISGLTQIPAIMAWLKDKSMVTFANRTDGSYSFFLLLTSKIVLLLNIGLSEGL